MKNILKSDSGVAMMIMVFVLLIMSMLGAVVVSMQANYFESSRSHLRLDQAAYLEDAGLERAIQYTNFDTAYVCPSNLTEYITVGGAPGHYDVCWDSANGKAVSLGQMDVQ